jgi:hypothetical protein
MHRAVGMALPAEMHAARVDLFVRTGGHLNRSVAINASRNKKNSVPQSVAVPSSARHAADQGETSAIGVHNELATVTAICAGWDSDFRR